MNTKGDERLQVMLSELAKEEGLVPGEDKAKDAGQGGADEGASRTVVTCPGCGHEFTPTKAAQP